MNIQHFFDEQTGTLSYVVSEPESSEAAVIDPVLNFDYASGRTSTASIDAISACLTDNRLTLRWILETHAHADHLTGARYLKRRHGGQVAIGAGICDVQRHFVGVFGLGEDFSMDGRQFDVLLRDGDTIALGAMEGNVIATPGHTDDSVSYRFGSSVFVGDSLFMPDYGTARCDFPGGDAAKLYASIQRLLSLPDDTDLFMCHDYRPGGRELRWRSRVKEQREANVHVGSGISEADFVPMRNARDAGLGMPALIVPAIQVNIRAGAMPPAERNGVTYLKLPIDAL